MLIIYSCLSAKMCAQHTYLPVKRHGMGEKHGETGGAWRRRLAIYVTKMGKTTQKSNIMQTQLGWEEGKDPRTWLWPVGMVIMARRGAQGSEWRSGNQ